MVIVYQEHKYGCGIACLAMFANLNYSEVKNKFFASRNLDKYGISNIDIITTLSSLGFTTVERRKIPKTKAILTVESINKKNSWHSVYWNGKELFDPQITGNIYTYEKLFHQKELFLSAIYSKSVNE